MSGAIMYFAFLYQIEVTTEILENFGQFPSLNNAFHKAISEVFCHRYQKWVSIGR
jgi:hypothetical protein